MEAVAGAVVRARLTLSHLNSYAMIHALLGRSLLPQAHCAVEEGVAEEAVVVEIPIQNVPQFLSLN